MCLSGKRSGFLIFSRFVVVVGEVAGESGPSAVWNFVEGEVGQLLRFGVGRGSGCMTGRLFTSFGFTRFRLILTRSVSEGVELELVVTTCRSLSTYYPSRRNN